LRRRGAINKINNLKEILNDVRYENICRGGGGKGN
jgi:hypothetical protein